ncbi:MAG: LysR substrate-binding domain-containing protein [Gammaproteobacteria bacterium]|nr:LysR substrate-binding domain-containing protein [Gammaproteobacteria bacterium]
MPLPPLRSLAAFAAVARHGSVSRAAEELAVTQPAVTQHLRRLETHFGLPLVRRTGARIELTAEGSAFAARLTGALREIELASEALAARAAGAGRGAGLSVSVLATFAQRWLIPRLASFQEAHPELDVRLITASGTADLERGDVDVSVRMGDGRWPGCHAERLMASRVFPVASPALLAARPVARPRDLAAHVLIRVEATPRDADWPRWLAACGEAALTPHGWLGFSSSIHALEAAVAGLGIAIGHTPFVIDALAAGRLSAPFPAGLALDEGAWWVVSRRERAGFARVEAFRTWLLEQARSDAHATHGSGVA